jgi:hypothetical protein
MELLSDTITVDGLSGPVSCHWEFDTFNASAGVIAGNVMSSYAVRFVLSSLSAFNGWAAPTGAGQYHSKDCIGPAASIVAKDYVTSYSFQATLPSSGEFVALFINTDSSQNVNVQISFYSTTSSAFTSTSDMLLTQTGLLTESPTTTSAISSQSSSGGTNQAISGFPTESILIGIIIAMLILVVNRRRSTSRT